MFRKLFTYISGGNEKQESINMTVPVLSTMTPNEDDTMTKKMCFYLGRIHQANPPAPTDSAVEIVETKEMTVFVYKFGGYAMEDSVWMSAAADFAAKLTSEDVDLSSFFTAGYDSPMKFWNRRNEVMFKKNNAVNNNNV